MKRSTVVSRITFDELNTIIVAADLLAKVRDDSSSVSDEMSNITQEILTEGDVLRLMRLADVLHAEYSKRLSDLNK